MYIGAHVSIGGGLPNAPKNAADKGCECFQIFSRSPRGGPAKEITPKIARAFRSACKIHAQHAWYIHTPYYINLASDRKKLRDLSVQIIREELERGRAIGAKAVMTHMGGAADVDAGKRLVRVIDGIKAVLDGYRGQTKLLVENTAGPESSVGRCFEDLSSVVNATRGRCGVCLDTQHAYASGHDLRTASAVRNTIDEFDRIVGLAHLGLIHCNDSKTTIGSYKDRHEFIGKGEIGKAGFTALLDDPRLYRIDYIVETKPEGSTDDVSLLKRLRGKR